MASPQLENGYVRIANELFEEIAFREFSKNQISIINLVIRLSYACRKKFALIKNKNKFQIAGVHPNYISEELEYLEKNKVLIIYPDLNVYVLNKNYVDWTIPYKKRFNKKNFNELLNENLNITQHFVETINNLLIHSIKNVERLNIICGIDEAESASTEQVSSDLNTVFKDSIYNTMSNKENCIEILNYLNQLTGKEFKILESNLKPIAARLNEYSIDELKSMIDFKVNEWENDKKMSVYLRPSTLFNASKCAGYVAESKKDKTLRKSNNIDSDKYTVQTKTYDLGLAAQGVKQ